jgi:hypothetical protein
MVTSFLLLQLVFLHNPDKPDATCRDGSISDQKEINVCRTRNQNQDVIAINCSEGTHASVPIAVYILAAIRYRSFILIKIVVSKYSAQI